MARLREFKPETVLDAALDLFWKKGYKACSMADVVKQSGVARYGVYQAFKDKDCLYCATLLRYKERLRERFVKFAHQAAIERAGQDDRVNEIVNDIFQETQDTYRKVLENALEDGDVRPMPIEDLVIYVMGIQRAVIAMTKQNCSLDERRNYVRSALAMLRPN